MNARVKDVMTTRVVAVLKNTTFKEIVALLTEHRVSAFPVLDEDDSVIGVVSEADLLSKEALVSAIGAQVARIGGVAGLALSRRVRQGGRGDRRRPDEQASRRGHPL